MVIKAHDADISRGYFAVVSRRPQGGRSSGDGVSTCLSVLLRLVSVLRVSGGAGLSHRGLRHERLSAHTCQVFEGDRRPHRGQGHVRPQRCPEHGGGRVQRVRGPGLQAHRERKPRPLPPPWDLAKALSPRLRLAAVGEGHEHAGGEDQTLGQEDARGSSQAERHREASQGTAQQRHLPAQASAGGAQQAQVRPPPASLPISLAWTG